jgi:hypothetical protein
VQIVKDQCTRRLVPPVQPGQDVGYGRGVGQLCDRGNRLPQLGDEAVLGGVVGVDWVPADRHRNLRGHPGQQCGFSRTRRRDDHIEATGCAGPQWMFDSLAHQTARLRRAQLLLPDGV